MCFATLSLMSAPRSPCRGHVKTGGQVALEEHSPHRLAACTSRGGREENLRSPVNQGKLPCSMAAVLWRLRNCIWKLPGPLLIHVPAGVRERPPSKDHDYKFRPKASVAQLV